MARHLGTRTTSHLATRTLAAIGVGAILLEGSKVLLNFFGPALPYDMPDEAAFALDSPEFLQFLSLVTDGTLRRSRVTRLLNGAEFFPAELAAIRRAKHAINLEFYEFSKGRVGEEFVEALAERARAGVEVRVIVDALGSFSTHGSFFAPVVEAGGEMRWYHPVRWDTWQKANNRTHRKLMVIDGETGFIGGAGISDRWLYATGSGRNQQPVWRDTMFCVEGEAVAGMISTFCENWLECSGEILSGAQQFAFRALPEGVASFVVSSTPHGGATQARILFQALIKSARKTIRITSPYFLPDRSARRALEEAVRKRGVEVEILTAGPLIDHPVVRRLSRRNSRHLIRAGAAIYEYQPSMIHAKLMTIDGLWNVVGSTNFDHRSFALNDEVNLAVRDEALAGVIEEDFAQDLRSSQKLTLAMLRERTLLGVEVGMVDHVMKLES